jgi:glucuronate isomerase
MTDGSLSLSPDRYFSPDPAQKSIAIELYEAVKLLPLVCPHGHVDPRVFADPDYDFGSPADLFIIPDHYIFRMLYSQGIALECLGIPTKDGTPVETDHRTIWQLFADNFYLFHGTPTGMWLTQELSEVFDVQDKLTGETALAIYDHIESQLKKPQFRPRALYERFNIEVLATTDPATSTLNHHQVMRDSGWGGRVLPTFRPDSVVNIDAPGWRENIDLLSDVSGITIRDYRTYIQALEQRRIRFKEMGATATDHAALTPFTAHVSDHDANNIFQTALSGQPTTEDARRFTGHMLMEMARMSVDDGLIMQLHVGALRNHNQALFHRFGVDMGADIPIQTEFTRNLQPLLNTFGSDSRFALILFTLDETTYSRELAPLAGHYPAVRLGPPWWFYDSLNGMRRFFDRVMETAGLYNTAGFNDDTRAFPSIPARHDLWRRAAADWIAGLVVRGIIDHDDAQVMIHDCAYGLAKRAYRLQ